MWAAARIPRTLAPRTPRPVSGLEGLTKRPEHDEHEPHERNREQNHAPRLAPRLNLLVDRPRQVDLVQGRRLSALAVKWHRAVTLCSSAPSSIRRFALRRIRIHLPERLGSGAEASEAARIGEPTPGLEPGDPIIRWTASAVPATQVGLVANERREPLPGRGGLAGEGGVRASRACSLSYGAAAEVASEDAAASSQWWGERLGAPGEASRASVENSRSTM